MGPLIYDHTKQLITLTVRGSQTFLYCNPFEVFAKFTGPENVTNYNKSKVVGQS